MRRIVFFTIFSLLIQGFQPIQAKPTDRLPEVLKKIFPDVQFKDGHILLRKADIEKLNDNQFLRKNFLPANEEQASRLGNQARETLAWSDFIQLSELKTLTLDGTSLSDVDGTLSIKVASVFDKKVAHAYIEAAIESLPMHWSRLSKSQTPFVDETADAVHFHYRKLFAPFLCVLPMNEQTDGYASIPVEDVVKRIIGSCAGPLVLSPVEGQPHTFRVSTLSIGDRDSQGKISVCIDVSASMAYSSKIDVLRKGLPTFFDMLIKLSKKGKWDVDVTLFNDKVVKSVTSAQLTNLDEFKGVLENVDPDGSTDLTIATNLIQRQESETGAVLIVLTDGEHCSSQPLPTQAEIEAIQRSGTFAHPYLLHVGPQNEGEAFFNLLSPLGRSANTFKTMESLVQHLGDSEGEWFKAKLPLIYALDDQLITLWQPNHKPGLFSSDAIVGANHAIRYNSITTQVSLQKPVVFADQKPDPQNTTRLRSQSH